MSEIEDLRKKLAEAADSYYNTGVELMSDYEYDKLSARLEELEKEANETSSPVTGKVGATPHSNLKKVSHKVPALSLAKTKDIDALASWLGDEEGCLSWKLDGLTTILTYKDGKLVTAATRGNGHVGEDITEQAKHFAGVPHEIPCKDEVIVRGESLISYSEFDAIKSTPEGEKFKNPRNLAAGTVRSLDMSVFDKRHIQFLAFTNVTAKGSSYSDSLDWLESQGFSVVEHSKVSPSTLNAKVDDMTDRALTFEYPVDGLVLYIDSIAKQRELGDGTHHPNYGMAFKWQDETKRATLLDIEWSKSRTGRLNPVAVFTPVWLCGSTVERASLHNLSYIEEMKLGIGDEIEVYKANMVIPQIAENHTKSLKSIDEVIPTHCPNCGGEVQMSSSKFLHCDNPECGCASSKAEYLLRVLGIKGVSTKTLEKLEENGLISKASDIFSISEDATKIEGIGKHALEILQSAKGTEVKLWQYISSLGILGVSTQNAKAIANEMKTVDAFLSCTKAQLKGIPGIGSAISSQVVRFLEENAEEAKTIAGFLDVKEVVESNEGIFSGKTIAVTGKVEAFKSRKEIEELVEANGGKLGGVSKSTAFLVTDDTMSKSSKMKKAIELGIKTITSYELKELLGA